MLISSSSGLSLNDLPGSEFLNCLRLSAHSNERILKIYYRVYKNQFLKYILRMAKHPEQPSRFRHITDLLDIPRNPEAVFDHEGHIKPSYMSKFVAESLKAKASYIESFLESHRTLNVDEQNQIVQLRKKAEEIEQSSNFSSTGMSDEQFNQMSDHVVRCAQCNQKATKLSGDLPLNGLPFGE